MRNINEKLEWVRFDTETLPEDLQRKLEVAQEAQKAAVEFQKEFEAAFIAVANKEGLGAPKGTEIKFGYRFGGLAIAYAPIKEKAAPKAGMGFGNAKARTRTLRPSKK